MKAAEMCEDGQLYEFDDEQDMFFSNHSLNESIQIEEKSNDE